MSSGSKSRKPISIRLGDASTSFKIAKFMEASVMQRTRFTTQTVMQEPAQERRRRRERESFLVRGKRKRAPKSLDAHLSDDEEEEEPEWKKNYKPLDLEGRKWRITDPANPQLIFAGDPIQNRQNLGMLVLDEAKNEATFVPLVDFYAFRKQQAAVSLSKETENLELLMKRAKDGKTANTGFAKYLKKKSEDQMLDERRQTSKLVLSTEDTIDRSTEKDRLSKIKKENYRSGLDFDWEGSDDEGQVLESELHTNAKLVDENIDEGTSSEDEPEVEVAIVNADGEKVVEDDEGKRLRRIEENSRLREKEQLKNIKKQKLKDAGLDDESASSESDSDEEEVDGQYVIPSSESESELSSEDPDDDDDGRYAASAPQEIVVGAAISRKRPLSDVSYETEEPSTQFNDTKFSTKRAKTDDVVPVTVEGIQTALRSAPDQQLTIKELIDALEEQRFTPRHASQKTRLLGMIKQVANIGVVGKSKVLTLKN